MAKVSTNITIDADVKAKAQELFAEFGLDLSTAINIFLRQSIRDNSIPFQITREQPVATANGGNVVISERMGEIGKVGQRPL